MKQVKDDIPTTDSYRCGHNKLNIKIMEGFNMGPEWFWNLLAVLAVVGALTGISAIVYLIYYLFTHIRFV